MRPFGTVQEIGNQPLHLTHIGMVLCGPDPDFAGLAKSMGWYSEGPFEKGDDLKLALKRALINAVYDRRNHG